MTTTTIHVTVPIKFDGIEEIHPLEITWRNWFDVEVFLEEQMTDDEAQNLARADTATRIWLNRMMPGGWYTTYWHGPEWDRMKATHLPDGLGCTVSINGDVELAL